MKSAITADFKKIPKMKKKFYNRTNEIFLSPPAEAKAQLTVYLAALCLPGGCCFFV